MLITCTVCAKIYRPTSVYTHFPHCSLQYGPHREHHSASWVHASGTGPKLVLFCGRQICNAVLIILWPTIAESVGTECSIICVENKYLQKKTICLWSKSTQLQQKKNFCLKLTLKLLIYPFSIDIMDIRKLRATQ